MVFAKHRHESAMGVYMCPPSWNPSHLPHSIPQGHPSGPALSSLSHASNLDWRSISYMVIYMFQSYSFKSSHPRRLPQSPKDCSSYLCLFCCLAYRVIVTIFLNSIYIRQYTVLVFFFLTYFTLFNRLQLYMEFRKMVTMTLYARQLKRHRWKEQTFGLCGRRWELDDLRE